MQKEPLLEIKDLHACAGEKEILKGVSLTVNAGEVHVIMGRNGSGKSTLLNVIAGHPAYQVTGGSIFFKGKDVLAMKPDERANVGLFLAFQNPTELPGVGTALFLKTALNAKRHFEGQADLDAVGFMRRLKPRAQAIGISDEMLKRSVNVGFSGGEKKRLEIFQMAFLEPDFCMLDEPDSGLDVDAVKTLSEAITVMREPKRSFLLVTHLPYLLNIAEFAHIMIDGRIVDSGDKTLALTVNEKGYEQYK